jgi:alanine dehydrogenase
MEVGIAKEIAAHGREVRVALLPEEVKQLTKEGISVYVEAGAGKGVYVSDREYIKAGAKIEKSHSKIFKKDIVVKLKCPLPKEFELLSNNILFSMLHAEQNPQCIKWLKKQRAKAVAMEEVRDEAHQRLIKCSELGGEQGMLLAFCHSPKSPQHCEVLVLGYGQIASGALRVAFSLGSKVKILRKSEYKYIKHHLKGKDIVINGISWPKKKRDNKEYLITKDMLKLLNPGAIILDLSVDYPNPIETCRPTSLDSPFFIVDGVKHIDIYGYPGLAPVSSSREYSVCILPVLKCIIKFGLKNAPPYIKKAIFPKV